MRIRNLAVTMAVTMAAASSAHAITVDFSAPHFTAGAVPTDFTIGGVTLGFEATDSRTNEIRILDTTSSSSTTGTGNDPDLAGPFDDANDADLVTDRSFGNALIIQEGGTSTLIDDEGQGGSMIISFSAPVTLGEVAMLDIDSATNVFINGSDTAIATGQTLLHGLPGDGPNQWYGFDLNISNVSELKLQFQGSGALGEFSFTADDVSAVPLPAGFPLLLGGAAALAMVKRRRQRT